MEKLQFTFKVMAGADNKSNFVAMTSISTIDGKTYLIPEEFQAVANHQDIMKTPAYARVKNSIKKRHQTRNVWITLTKELEAVYLDKDENLIFGDQFLELEEEKQITSSNSDQLIKILEKLTENQEKNRNIKKLAEKFVIDKFDARNTNVHQWMEIFEKECERFGITADEEKIEIFRIFLEKNCLDWYGSTMIKLTLRSKWSQWKQNFCDTYEYKGWTASRYALSFKYQSGLLLDYAIKKEKLLLELRKTIDKGTLIDIIAAGLPQFVVDRINREEIKEIKDLFSEIGKLEHLTKKKNFAKKENEMKPNSERKQKCTICEKLKKGVRFHPESSCWYKSKENEEKHKEPIRLVNNSELECDLTDEEPKN